ncbi:uncharacterized protein LOC113648052 isoform X1 [Tachysurus ichikawai]
MPMHFVGFSLPTPPSNTFGNTAEQIPQPDKLLKRVEGVMKLFHLASDPNDVPLYKRSMLKTWCIQCVHILRGCISDPEVSGEILYRHGGTIQLNHVQAWVLGTAKYPILQVCTKDTGERFGLEYVEPGCHPVVPDLEKHKSKTTQAFSPADQGSTPTAQSADHPGELDVTSSPLLVAGPVRYFYCSTKVFKAYSGEGLTNSRMPFQDFMETEFFQRELASTKKRVEEKRQQKRKRPDHQGMEKEMTWKEFQKSPFYEIERQRWVAERRK